MFSLSFRSVCIEAIGINKPPHEVSSLQIEERLSALYTKLGIPFGTLERMSGVKSRYFWNDDVLPSQAGLGAVERALSQCDIKPSEVGALLSCSVSRDCFEPATATIIHGKLGLREDTIAFDISNACVGFSNGLAMAANMIESGVIESAIVVSGETVSRMVDAGINRALATPDMDRDTLLAFLPTVTLGSGAVAYVLCHEKRSKNKHRLAGMITRSATQFNDLCVGNGDFCSTQKEDYQPFMVTDAPKLIASAATTGARAWGDLSQLLNWKAEDVNHVVCHQVGRQVNDAFYRTVGLDRAKEYVIYPTHGNLVSAAMPTAFGMAVDGRQIRRDDKIVLMGYGSGLNAIFTGVIW